MARTYQRCGRFDVLSEIGEVAHTFPRRNPVVWIGT